MGDPHGRGQSGVPAVVLGANFTLILHPELPVIPMGVWDVSGTQDQSLTALLKSTGNNSGHNKHLYF